MHIKDVKVKKNKDVYNIKFVLSFDNEEWTKNWMTIYKQKGKWYFNNIVYRFDEEKKEALFAGYQKRNIFNTPEAWLYYDLEKTNELINLLYEDSVFKEFVLKDNISFDKNRLFYRNPIIKRQENLKKCMKLSYERKEHIGIIGRNAEYYIPLEEIDEGFHLLNMLPGGDVYDEEESGIDLLSEMELGCENEYYFKRWSFIGSRVLKDGKEIECEDIGNMAWELQEEVLFFDELFYCDSMVKLAEEILSEHEDGYFLEYDEDEELALPISAYDLFDIIMYNNDGVFTDAQFKLESKRERFIKKITKDYNLEQKS